MTAAQVFDIPMENMVPMIRRRASSTGLRPPGPGRTETWPSSPGP